MSARLKHNRGFLHGSNGGEWGGALTWKPDVGPSKEVYKGYNVTAIFPEGDGAIVMIEMNHMEINFGIVTWLDLSADNHWALHEVARLPTSSSETIKISPGIYAARSGHRVTVFNRTRILGLATCLGDMPKETAK